MQKPLVTVFVITYNSNDYIIEALESVKLQTYPNIELVVTDDNSRDNTVELVKEWMANNKQYFKNIVLVTSPVNTGVALNCNRGVKASSGKWLKVLAGDDKLPFNSIEDYVNFFESNPDYNIVFGKLRFYGNNKELTNEIKNLYEQKLYPKIKTDLKNQYRYNLVKLSVPGPGLMFSRELYDEVGGFDEKYPTGEEHPFTIYLLEKNYHIGFLDKVVYCYNVRENSLGKGSHYIKKDIADFFYDYRIKKLKKEKLYLELFYLKSHFDIYNRKPQNFIKKIPFIINYFIARKILSHFISI